MSRADRLDATARYFCRVRGEVSVPWLEADAATILDAYPVRVPDSRSGQSNYSGLFWSATIDAHLVYESLLELDRLWLADFDPDITTITSQPLWIEGMVSGKVRRHAPDFLLKSTQRGHVLVDVKPAKAAARPEIREVFDWTGALCARKGWAYEVWTGADVFLLRNVRFLGSARRAELISQSAVVALLDRFTPGTTINALIKETARTHDEEQVRSALLHLMWKQLLSTDLRRPLSGETVLDVGVGANYVEH